MAIIHPLEPRQQVTPAVHVVTQIITRASTTITALVTLGVDSTISTIPTPPPLAPVTTSTPPPPPAPTSSSVPLTNEQLGAILGSVIGFLVIVLPLCYCCFRRSPDWGGRGRRRRRYPYSDSGSSSGSGSSVVEVRPGRPDPWRRPPPPRPVYQPVLVPPPPRIPPMRYAPYRQTPQPQIPGVRVYP